MKTNSLFLPKNRFTLILLVAITLLAEKQAFAQFSRIETIAADYGGALASARNGHLIAVGPSPTTSGSKDVVSVYQKKDSSWVKRGNPIGFPEKYAGFGASISMAENGEYIAIAAPASDSGATYGGAVAVFEWKKGDWMMRGQPLLGDQAHARLGESLSLSQVGNTLAIGAPQSNVEGDSAVGSVKVYRWIDGQWILRGKVLTGTIEGARFGHSIKLAKEGQLQAVASAGKPNNVKVFKWNNQQWQYRGNPVKTGPDDHDYSAEIDLTPDGSTMVVSTTRSGDFANGIVQVYKWVKDQWIPRGQPLEKSLEKNSAIREVNLCYYVTVERTVSMAHDGKTIAVRTPAISGTDIQTTGSIRVYRWEAGQWLLLGSRSCRSGAIIGSMESYDKEKSISIKDNHSLALSLGGNSFAFNEDDNVYWNKIAKRHWLQIDSIVGYGYDDRFGQTLDLSSNGQILAIGSPDYSEDSPHAGLVQTFTLKDGSWIPMGEDLKGDRLSFTGAALELSGRGHTMAVGAPEFKNEKGNAGSVRAYQWLGNAWQPKGERIEGRSPGERKGAALALSSNGNILAVAAPKAEEGRGVVTCYQWNGKVWIERGQSLKGASSGDHFGKSISMDSSGNYLLIGAPFHGEGDALTGKVYSYRWENDQWKPMNSILSGEQPTERFGKKLDLSDNGQVLVVGAPTHNSPQDTMAGCVRVYERKGKNWKRKGKPMYGNEYALLGESISISGDGSQLVMGSPETAGFWESGYMESCMWSPVDKEWICEKTQLTICGHEWEDLTVGMDDFFGKDQDFSNFLQKQELLLDSLQNRELRTLDSKVKLAGNGSVIVMSCIPLPYGENQIGNVGTVRSFRLVELNEED